MANLEPLHPTLDLSRLVYTKSAGKVDVSCRTCGYGWSPIYNSLQQGQGCPKCAVRGQKLTQEEALAKLEPLHPTIDFSRFVYAGSISRVNVSCSACGNAWSPIYNNLQQGYGCPKCAGNAQLTQDEALARLEPLHPTLDFSRLVYTKSAGTVDVSCKTCGYGWSPIYNSLQRGQGCPKCAGVARPTQGEALASLEQIHTTIDFSRLIYTGTCGKVDVSCKTCGNAWSPTYKDLQRGCGCPKCAGNVQLTQEEALAKLEPLHPKIDLSRLVYTNNKARVDVSCKTCGYEWSPTYSKLRQGRGCPKCKSSKGEKRVAKILGERCIAYETERKVAGKLRLDFYIPSLGVGIEVQGVQHYFVNEFFGGVENFKRQVKNDRRKRQWCKANGVKLISIPYLNGKTDNFERYLREIHPMREQAELF